MVGFFKRRVKSLLGSLQPSPVVSTLLECHFPYWRYCRVVSQMPWEVLRVKTQIWASGWTMAPSVCHFLIGDIVLEASVFACMLVADLVAFIVSALGGCSSALIALVAR
jgi:hypothetical protein